MRRRRPAIFTLEIYARQFIHISLPNRAMELLSCASRILIKLATSRALPSSLRILCNGLDSIGTKAQSAAAQTVHITRLSAKTFISNGQRNLSPPGALMLIRPILKLSTNIAKKPTKTKYHFCIAIIAQTIRQNGNQACHSALKPNQKPTTITTKFLATFIWAQKLKMILSSSKPTAYQPTTSPISSTMPAWA